MANKVTGPQYLTSDGRFTNERPKWMRPKGCDETPDISEFLPPEAKYPAKKKYEVRQLSEGAAHKIAKVLHVMLNEKK